MVFILLLDSVPYALADGTRWYTTSQDEAERAAESLRRNTKFNVQVCPVPAHVAGL